MEINELVDKYFDQIKETITYDEEDSAYLSFRIPMDMLKEYIKIKNTKPSLSPNSFSLPNLSEFSEEYSYNHWSEVEKIYEDRERFAKEFWEETNLIKKLKEYAKARDFGLMNILDFLEGNIALTIEVPILNSVGFSVEEIRED